MSSRPRELLSAVVHINQSERIVSLAAAAQVAALSPSHFRREFISLLGESPARYQQRLRLERGAGLLLSTEARVIEVALEVGFESHEAFTRAFRLYFGLSPRQYRRRSPGLTPGTAERVATTGPCVRLYCVSTSPPGKGTAVYTISIESIDETPVLFGRRRVDRDRMTQALGELIPAAYGYAVEKGLAMAGPPFVRYIGQSAAFLEIEAGVPLLEPATVAAQRSDILAGSLPGGEAAVTTHTGPYDTLGNAHVALDRWMNQMGRQPSGGPWEVYVTDPGEVPDPADWQTKIIWPLA